MTDPLLILTGEVERVQQNPLFSAGVAEGTDIHVSITGIYCWGRRVSKNQLLTEGVAERIEIHYWC